MMAMKSVVIGLLMALLSALPVCAGDAYTEGTVWQFSYIRTEPGHQADYVQFLAGEWKQVLEQAKKDGLVVSYRVLRSAPTTPTDWDILIILEMENMAALDGAEDRWNALTAKVFGGKEAKKQKEVGREQIRKWIGNRIARELLLK